MRTNRHVSPGCVRSAVPTCKAVPADLGYALSNQMKVTVMTAERATAGSRIYKIADTQAWQAARHSGRFIGSADDARDGFIHLSRAHQVAGTLAKHFAGRQNLVLVEVDAELLGTALRWEPARDGSLFPHLHGPLDMGAVISEKPLELGGDGRHLLPQGFRSC